MSIIACEDAGDEGAPLSSVVAVVPLPIPPPEAVGSIIRQLRQSSSDALVPEEADALIVSMHHGMTGLGSALLDLNTSPPA